MPSRARPRSAPRARSRPKSAPRARSQAQPTPYDNREHRHVVRLPTATVTSNPTPIRRARPASATATRRPASAGKRDRGGNIRNNNRRGQVSRNGFNSRNGGAPNRSGNPNEENTIVQAMEKVVLGLVRDNRLVEAVTLSHKLSRSAEKEGGITSKVFRHCCTLTVKLTLELGEQQEEKGGPSDILLTIDYLKMALEIVGKSCPAMDDPTMHHAENPWVDQCLLHRLLIHSTMGICYRRLGEYPEAEEVAERGLVTARERNRFMTDSQEETDILTHIGSPTYDQGVTVNYEKEKATRQAKEAEARCHLVLCTVVSKSEDHVRAMKHARVAASLLEHVRPDVPLAAQSRLNRNVMKSLGVAYYNVGAELEHIIASGLSFEGFSQDTDQADDSAWAPITWYKKALALAKKYPAVVSKDMTMTFEDTVKTCQQSRLKRRKLKRKKKRSPFDIAASPGENAWHVKCIEELEALAFEGDGLIDRDMFADCLKGHIDDTLVQDITNHLDKHNDGVIPLRTFRNFMENATRQHAIDLILSLVKDKGSHILEVLGKMSCISRDGYLTCEQLQNLLASVGLAIPEEVESKLFGKEPARITFNELYNAISSHLVSDDHLDEEMDPEPFEWNTYDPAIHCTDAKLDMLEAFSLRDATSKSKNPSAGKRLSSRRRRKSQNTKDKTFVLKKELASKELEQKQMTREMVLNPVPITVAGFRTFHEEVLGDKTAVSNDGRTIRWPPMVRENELNALLVSNSTRKKNANVRRKKNSLKSPVAAEHKAIVNNNDEDESSDQTFSWSSKLRALREKA